MGEIAVHVENISKSYQITHSSSRGSYKLLREDIVGLLRRPFTRREPAEPSRETFWALKDVSFDVKHGEVLGIIGRNGAGKSTLLKILSRITRPTSGRIDVYGRIGSLLEVGTGFHPELTGRENVFLNGAVLGMTRRDIQKHFDEIVAFAEVEKFLDTPVKRYSSGMYTRLAFAVAAHLEPEVLIVDEVLAVGDAEFQKKCLGKTGDVARQGRTVLFVSHNVNAVAKLCSEGLFLKNGRIEFYGTISDSINEYVNSGITREGENVLDGNLIVRQGDGAVYFRRVATRDSHQRIRSEFHMGEKLIISAEIEASELIEESLMSVDLKTITGIPVLHLYSLDHQQFKLRNIHGRYHVQVEIDNLPLYPGKYNISFWLGNARKWHDYVEDCLTFHVSEGSLIKRKGLAWNKAVFFYPVSWQMSNSVGLEEAVTSAIDKTSNS